MTTMGAPKSGPAFPHDEIPWPAEPRFVEKRHGIGWRVFENGDDGVTRWTYTGTFWRWISAARVAQALTLAFNSGYHSDGECWQRNRDYRRTCRNTAMTKDKLAPVLVIAMLAVAMFVAANIIWP